MRQEGAPAILRPRQLFDAEPVGTALLCLVGLFPFLYAVVVDSPISGTRANPVRSQGPAIVSGQWEGRWIYWVGPISGSIAACLVCSFLAKRSTVAQLHHFDRDRDRLFRRMRGAKPIFG